MATQKTIKVTDDLVIEPGYYSIVTDSQKSRWPVLFLRSLTIESWVQHHAPARGRPGVQPEDVAIPIPLDKVKLLSDVLATTAADLAATEILSGDSPTS